MTFDEKIKSIADIKNTELHDIVTSINRDLIDGFIKYGIYDDITGPCLNLRVHYIFNPDKNILQIYYGNCKILDLYDYELHDINVDIESFPIEQEFYYNLDDEIRYIINKFYSSLSSIKI